MNEYTIITSCHCQSPSPITYTVLAGT